MPESEHADRICILLDNGVRNSIEAKDPEPLRSAALESYRLRMKGRGIQAEASILNHVFPADVEQTVRLGIHLQTADPEKASVVIKGAVEQILKRISLP